MVLNFEDNNEVRPRDDPLYNRCHKTQPFIDHFRIVFRSTVFSETFMYVDEQVVPFNGLHGMKCYVHKKPKEWGYKFWARAGISSYIYNFEVHGGL